MPSVALSKSAAQELLSQYGANISSNQTLYSPGRIMSQLDQQVQNLETIALQAYSALGFPGGNVEAIEQKLSVTIQQLQQETSRLNGMNLEECFLQALKNSNELNLDYSQVFEELRTDFAQQCGEAATSGAVAELMLQEIVQGIQPSLSGNITIGKNGQARSNGKLVINFAKPYNELSKQAKKMFDNYIQQRSRSKPVMGLLVTKGASQQTVNISSNSLDMQWVFNNFSIEDLLTMPSDSRARLFQLQPRLKDEINRRFIQQIVSRASVTDPALLTKCITDILNQKPLAFFTGGNIKAMTGILGEIQAMYFFSKLINNSNTGASVSWVGGMGNPHADLLLTQGLQQFGIQVKNTSMSGAKMEVSFKTFGAKRGKDITSSGYIYKYANTSSALNFIDDNFVDRDLFESIQTMLAMESFNVYYTYDKDTGLAKKADSNPEFTSERRAIEYYAQLGRKMALLMAASLLYMQESSYSAGESNTLYLIGGVTLISAATILKDIVREAKASLGGFNMRVSAISASKEEKSARTIVDLYNNKGRLTNTTFKLSSSYVFDL